MAEMTRVHPLENRRFALAGISLEPAPPCERVALRAGADAVDEIGKAIGCDLPVRPKTTGSGDKVTASWLGPDEWLLIGEPGADLLSRFQSVNDRPLSAVDVSHRNTAIIVKGSKATLTLNSGCPRNLSLDAFPAGACTRTILGKSEIVLIREGPEQFRVECWRSFSDYVWNFLVDAAKSA